MKRTIKYILGKDLRLLDPKTHLAGGIALSKSLPRPTGARKTYHMLKWQIRSVAENLECKHELLRTLIGVMLIFTPISLAVSTFQTTNLSIKYHDPKDKAQLEFVVLAWQEAQTKLRAIGLEPQTITLEAYASAAAFTQATGEPWFVAAVTQGKRIQTQRLGALKAQRILKFTILHEAFHTVQPAKLPRWLSEGLARTFSGESANDPNRTTLEQISEAQLNISIEGRKAQISLEQAYWEASRRAGKLLSTRGWKSVLNQYR
jgi:hypothetical protein